ncbi:UPF0187-domain-containing protein [Macrolepiota fuliginosa MF-IS2]|uniref:UPF0187-domain-containing protein n=1 Tax=Macrolepiota fuliginosa MF-IS2 TaxID=1400762 RepID=A0A9P6C229_9AGAR|nr:UPF0187-domain-containing protein [Macrolepiota fuliginosa MF-IS2]
MVARNPLFAVRWTRQLLRATVLDDIWPEILFFTTVATGKTFIYVICVISDTTRDLGISSVLLTVLGNVIVLQVVLAFRTSSASERYQEARALWASLATITKNLAQAIWIHVPNHRGPQDQTESVEMQAFIEKRSIINLLQALAVSVKHFVRDEQGVYYEDLYPLISWLPAFSNFTPDHPYWYKFDFRSSSATLFDDPSPSHYATRRSTPPPSRRNRSSSCSGEDSATDVESGAEAVSSPMRRATSSPRNSEETVPLTQSPTTDEPQASGSKNILDHERCASPEPTLLSGSSGNSSPQPFRLPPRQEPRAAEYRYEFIKLQQQDISDNDADSEEDEGEAGNHTSSIPLRGIKRVRFHSRTLVNRASRDSKNKHSRDETLVASDIDSNNAPEYGVGSGLSKPYNKFHATYDRILPHIPSFDQLKPAANPPPERIRDVFPLWRFIAFLGRGIKKVYKWDFEEKVHTKRRKRNPYVMVESSVPMQIWLTLSSYQLYLYNNKLMPIRAIEDSISNNILNLQNVISQLERLTNTPLPFAYQVHIRMCTWLYLLFLPFQLYDNFGYVTIPIVAFFTFLLVGFMEIGEEIENPFDYDHNDLDLDGFCLRLQRELHEITAQIHSEPSSIIFSSRNYPLAPVDWRTADTLIAEDAYRRTEDGRKEQTSAIQSTLFHCWKEIDQVTRKRV